MITQAVSCRTSSKSLYQFFSTILNRYSRHFRTSFWIRFQVVFGKITMYSSGMGSVITIGRPDRNHGHLWITNIRSYSVIFWDLVPRYYRIRSAYPWGSTAWLVWTSSARTAYPWVITPTPWVQAVEYTNW